jgi:hypothetical protein
MFMAQITQKEQGMIIKEARSNNFCRGTNRHRKVGEKRVPLLRHCGM